MDNLPTLYSLLYINTDGLSRRRHVNLRNVSEDPLEIYVRCGVTLARSCLSAGVAFKLLTNDAEAVYDCLRRIGAVMEVVEIQFSRAVPPAAPFFEAHFKLDVIREFGKGTLGDLVALIDLDAVVMERISVPVSPSNIWALDLTDIYNESYGYLTVRRDLSLAGAAPNASKWYGGEFIMANSSTFAELSNSIDECWPVYLSNIAKMRHVGDEAVVSAAISRLGDIRATNMDQTDHPMLSRYWSVRTLHKPNGFCSSAVASVLHLPADKQFLAQQSAFPFSVTSFLSQYKVWLRSRMVKAHIANAVDWLRPRRRIKHVPRW